MKPFDLEAAKNGAPIVARNGHPIKFIAYVPEGALNHRVVVLYGDVIRTFPESGKYYSSDHEGVLDLFMATRKRTVWVNMYPRHGESYWYETKAEADRGCSSAMSNSGRRRLGDRAWPVEVEE